MSARLVIPELRHLQDVRAQLARGGLPPLDKRTPEDCARIAAFRTLVELLRLFGRFKQRIEAGERCRLVEIEHPQEPGRLLIEIRIEAEEVAP